MSRSGPALWLSLLLLFAAAGAMAGRVPHALDALAAWQVHVAGLAALAALAFALTRRGAAAALSALAAGLALWGAEELWRDAARPAAPGETRALRLATANVFYANRELPALARALAGLEADVLVTLETPAALLAAPGPLGALYPHRRSWAGPNGRGGPAIWSRLPFVPSDTDRADGHPSHLIASVEAGLSRPLQIAALHLDWPVVGAQAWQFADFHRFWRLFEAPLVVAGDFNAAPWSAMTRRVEAITRTQVLGGWRPTFFGGLGGRSGRLFVPFGLPVDHVLVSPGIGAEGAETVALPGADHRAVVARLLLPVGEAPEAGGERAGADQPPPARTGRR
jgi:endonuclease/exonuclease/phosphatase (EEP) superfamily protein YafD